MFDQPNAGRGAGYADSLRNSGALAILLPWRIHRAGSTGTAAAASTGSTSPASGTLGLRLVGEEAVTVSTGSIWIATALVVPTGPVAAVSVDADALQFFRTDALTGATAGGDASVALAGGEALRHRAGRGPGGCCSRRPCWAHIRSGCTKWECRSSAGTRQTDRRSGGRLGNERLWRTHRDDHGLSHVGGRRGLECVRRVGGGRRVHEPTTQVDGALGARKSRWLTWARLKCA